MGGVQHFSELRAWREARRLVKEIYLLSGTGPLSRDFAFRDQVRSAAISVMSNIAEGFERGSRGEFHQFLVIAKASCAEVRSQLYVAQDVGYINQKTFDAINSSTSELSRIIGGLRVAVQKQRDNK